MSTGAFPDSLNKEARESLHKWTDHFIWDDPYLWKISDDKIFRRCIPDNEVKPILESCHSGPCGGHFGIERTKRKVLDSGFWWPMLHKDVGDYCKACDRCQRVGNISGKDEMPQQSMIFCEIFDVWGIDFMGPF